MPPVLVGDAVIAVAGELLGMVEAATMAEAITLGAASVDRNGEARPGLEAAGPGGVGDVVRREWM